MMHVRMTRFVLIFVFCVLTTAVAEAHQPVIVEQSANEELKVVDPTISKAYYGELTGFPHTFRITAESEFPLYVSISVPDIPEATNNVSAIIVRDRLGGGVAEVARLRAESATWEPFFELFGGDTYRQGASFDETVEAGTYRVEVHTPDNQAHYVLAIGKTEDFSSVGYFELIRGIAGVKEFFGKPPIAVLQSPFLYVPITLLLLLAGLGWYLYRRLYN